MQFSKGEDGSLSYGIIPFPCVVIFCQNHPLSRIDHALLVRRRFCLFRPMSGLGLRPFLGDSCGFFVSHLRMFSYIYTWYSSAELDGDVVWIKGID